jgi:molybdopterin-binding protein
MADPAHDDSSLDVAPTRLRIGAAAATLGVSADTLRRLEKEGRIHFERVGNQRVISSEEVERLLRDRPARARTSSARNRLEGTVVAIKRGRVMSQIELACGPFRVVSLMSREAADELELEPGVLAIATVKSTNVGVELPEQS